MPTTPERRIVLDGLYNLRDVGGYPTRDGKTTKWRTLLRSDSMHALTEESIAAVRALGLRTIVDLRREGEIAHEPNIFATDGEIRYFNLPIFDDRNVQSLDLAHRTHKALYESYVEHCRAQFRTILTTLTADDAAPALVHCKIGKDRTGVTIALLLGAAGVPDEVIAEDYAVSNGYLEPLLSRWRAAIVAGRDDAELERWDTLVQSPREAMLDLLGYLNERYGGVVPYLHTLDLNEDAIARIRRALVEE
jgi:protein-tyrosine phosphatase